MIKFGTDGWRAVISDEFTFANVRLVAKAIADYLKSQPQIDLRVVVGYDARFLADKFAEEVVKVLTAEGINCFLTERDTPTPVVAWEVKKSKLAGAVMLTASHNPPEYCGIKFIPHYAGPADEGITKQIEGHLANPKSEILNNAKTPNSKFERFEPRERYLNYLKDFVDVAAIKKAKLKVVVDPMFGSGRGYLDKLLQELGCQVEELHNYRDVLFGGRNPEPDDENLHELKDKVVASGADVGLALDGDADRFGIVDETGRFYPANQIIPLLLDYLAGDKKYSGVAVRSVATSHLVDRVAEKYGVKVFETPVGFKHIAKIMMEQDVIIGGEESGGLSIKGHIPEKDGILANLLVVEMLARKEKKFSDCWRDLISKVGPVFTKKINLKLSGEDKQKLIAALKNRQWPAGSWVLARPSGTEPLVRIYAEAESEETLEQIVAAVKSLV